METAAIIIVLVSAAVAAGAGLASAWVFSRYRGLTYPLYWFAIAGAVLGALVSFMIIADWPIRLFRSGEQVQIELVTPYMAALRAHEPQLYERVLTLADRDQQDGRSADEIRTNAMTQVLSYVADKVPQLPDDVVYEFYSFSRDELAYLAQANEFEVCADISLGRIRGDIDSKLSSELVDRYHTIVVRIIGTTANPNAARLASEPFSVMASQAFAIASQNTGIAPNEIDTLLAGQGEPQKVCKLMKNFFDAMLAQPVEAAGPALRALASGETSTR
ncbi:MAG: hypothetical protein ABL973_06215 [Micropepsaceae bacterium]